LKIIKIKVVMIRNAMMLMSRRMNLKITNMLKELKKKRKSLI